METPPDTLPLLADTSKRLAQRTAVICENRIELLMLEVQEERERILRVILFSLGGVTFALLGGITLTAAVTVAFWQQSPLSTLLILTGIYGGIATFFYVLVARLQRDWQTLPATIDQLKKDRACLEKQLG
jgi:uncharacterized membrane protein YqjE